MAVGKPNSYGRFGSIGAGHRAAVAYGAVHNGATPYSPMGNYGAGMTRPGFKAPDASTQTSTSVMSKQDVQGARITQNLTKAIAAAKHGQTLNANTYLRRAVKALQSASGSRTGLASTVAAAQQRVAALLAEHAAQNAVDYGDEGVPGGDVYTEEYIEEYPEEGDGMSTGAKVAIGGGVLALLAFAGWAATS